MEEEGTINCLSVLVAARRRDPTRFANRKPKLRMARQRAVRLAEQQGPAAREVAAHFLITALGDAASASVTVTKWSSKPLVQGITDVISSQWLAHHAGDADGARIAIDMFFDGGLFYSWGVFDAGRWYPGRTQFARYPALAAMAFQRCSRTWAAGGGGPRGGSPVDRIAGRGIAVSKVAGARSRGARSRRPEEWQRLEAIKEWKKLRREGRTRSTRRSGACASTLDAPSSRFDEAFRTSSQTGGAAAWTIPRASWRQRARCPRTCMTGDRGGPRGTCGTLVGCGTLVALPVEAWPSACARAWSQVLAVEALALAVAARRSGIVARRS